MNRYRVVEPCYEPTGNKTIQGDRIFTVRFEPVTTAFEALTAELALESVKKHHKHAIIERINE